MRKKLSAVGNSFGLVIEKPILELLHITIQTPLEVTTDGRNLIISPVSDAAREKKIARALSKINQRHSKTLKALVGP